MLVNCNSNGDNGQEIVFVSGSKNPKIVIFQNNNPRNQNEPEYILFNKCPIALYRHGANGQKVHNLEFNYQTDDFENEAKNAAQPLLPWFPISNGHCLTLSNINCMLQRLFSAKLIMY